MTDPRLDYISKVYSALKDNVSGFNKTPGDFLDSMNNPDYRQKVYSALKDNVQGFNKSQQDFESVTAQKKNSLLTSSPYYVAAPEDTEDSQTSSTVATPSQSQSGSVPQSSSQETQQSKPQQPQAFDPATFMRKSRELALENTPVQDNTVAVQPSRNVSATESQLNKVANQKRSEEVKKEAIVNSTAQYLKNKGINAPVGSAQFNQQLAKTQALVDNGQAIVGVSPDGQFGLKRVTGVWENLKNGWNEATQNAKEADDFVNNMTTQQQVDYVKSHDVKQPDQFIGEQPSTLGSFGHFIGGAAPFLGKATAGALIGAGAVAAAPESMGASLAGLPTAMSFILTAPDMANQGAQQEIIRRFQILKNQNPDMSDVDAMEEARKGALAGGIGGILTNAALMGTGLKTPLSLEAKGVVGKTLQEVGKSAVHMGAVSAGVTAAQQLEGEAEGIHTSASDKLKAIEDSFKENATTGAMLTALMHGVPKIMESAIKYSLKDTPPDQIRNVLQANENAGTVPEGTTDKVMSDISSYNDALNKTVDGLSPEATASVAGLIQKKNSLIEESKTKDDSFKPVYKEKIDAIDRQIQDIQRTGKPFEHEIDEVTGKPYQQPTYDDVAQQQVQELAQKIAKGKQVTDPQDLQTQANFPKELEAELQRLQKEEQTSQAGKENPKSIISDNIKSYLDNVSSEKPAEPVSSPVISDLSGEVMMNGERGHLRTDEENNVLFDNGTKETLLGKTTDKNFNSTKAADLGIKPIPKVEVKGDNVKIDGEDYTLNHDKEGGAFGKDKDGNVVSVNVLKDGEPRTIRDKDLALDIAIAKNNHDFESKPEPKDYAPVQQAIKDSFTAEHGHKADDIINSMPDEVADTFAAMDNKIEALAPEETQAMVIRASEWADKAREEIKNGSSSEKEKSDAIKMLDKFDKDLNKYYGKLEKQRKSQADADVKREQAESLAAAKQRSKADRQKAKQLELEAVEKDNLATTTESRNRTYKRVNQIEDPTDSDGIALQYFAGGGKVDEGEMTNEVTGRRKTSMNRTGKTSDAEGNTLFEKNGNTVDQVAHNLWDNLPEHLQDGIDIQDIRNALINVMGSHEGRFSAAKEFVEKYDPEFVEVKHNREQAEAYQAYEKKLQEDEENYLTEKGHEQDEIEQDPEYIKHLIKLYETETVPVNDKKPDTGGKAESSEARSVTEDVEPEGADRPERPSELRRPAEDQPRSDEEQPQSSKKQVGDIFRNFADIIDKGKISKLGGFKASTGFDAVWDGSLTVVAETLRKTADLADAIQAGLEHIKNSDWYKSLTDKKDFDEKYVAHLEGEYNKFKQPKEEQQITVTSIKNAQVDQERAARGLPSAIEPAKKEFGKTWGEAMQKIDKNPTIGQELVDELKSKPRPLSDVENAILLHQQILTQNDYAATNEAINTAKENGDTKGVMENTLHLAKVSDDLLDIYNVGKAAGTENARGLATRKMMAKEDFTLAAMETAKRAANGGDALTEKQATEIKELHQRIEATTKAYEEALKKAEERAKVAEEKLSNESAQKKFVKIKEEASLEEKTQKRAQNKEAISAKKKELKDQLKNQWKQYSRGQLNAGVPLPVEMIPTLAKLAKEYIKDGINTLDGVVDRLHADLSEFIEGIDKRTVRDALSGYGKIRKPNLDEIERQLSEIKQQGMKISAIEDAMKGEAPKKSGFQRPKPSDVVRGLDRQLKKAIKDNNIQVTDAEKQLSTFLNAAKTRIENEISDLTEAIKTHIPIVKNHTGIEYTPELRQLKEQRNAKRAEYDDVFGTTTELTNEQRLERYKKQLAKQQEKYEKNLADLKKGEYKKKETKPLVLNDEVFKAKVAMERARNEFKAGLEKDKMKNRSTLQKILDGFVTTEREIKLTSPITIGKLTMAALHRVTTGVPEEILGGALSKILPKTITENSRNEAGFNVKMEAKAWTKGFMEGIKDSGKTIALKRTGKFSFGFKHGGKSDIEVAYGKHGLMPPEISHFFGHIHGALKAPVKRLAFERSVLKQSEWYIKHNINPNDPVIAMKIGLDAYKEGNRSIFMQDNAVSTAFTVFFRGLENNKVAPTSGKIIAAAGKFFMPFIKIPTNLVSETGNYAFGLIPGSIHLAKIGISKALGKGIEDLPPEQADMVMRNFKKGTLGAGVLLLGFFGYQNVGGYYQDHEKRKEGDVKAGGVRIFGYDPPNWALHNPLLECLQIGATARRVFDHYTGLNETKKKDYSPTMQATSASLTGLAKELPMVDQPIRVYKGIFGSDYEKSRFWGELLKSSTEPAMIQKAANWFDDRKVDPKTIWEYEKSGIPGLKNTLEEKHFKSEEPSVNYYHSKD